MSTPPKRKQKPKRVSLPEGVASIGDILPQLMARYGASRVAGSARLNEAWLRAVGDEVAKVTRLGAKKRGVLEVFVPHSTYAQELSFRVSEFLASLRVSVPEENIVGIKFRVGK
ncbi:MAG: DUF721 domain-containing protein [Thermoguttaceae bacterium]